MRTYLRSSAVAAVIALAGCSALPSPPVTTPAPVDQRETAGPANAPSSSPAELVALVPVVGFWSDRREIAMADLRAAIAGQSEQWHVLVGNGRELAALAASLGVTPGRSLVAGDTEAVDGRVRDDAATLGILPAADVGPGARALAVDGRSLFGTARVTALTEWPLQVALDADLTSSHRFDPAEQWTLVAGGDVMLDREVYRQTRLLGRGIDLPWDGGTARISSRRCCNSAGNSLPVAQLTGND